MSPARRRVAVGLAASQCGGDWPGGDEAEVGGPRVDPSDRARIAEIRRWVGIVFQDADDRVVQFADLLSRTFAATKPRC
jgi:hypothetical protein